MSKLAAAEGKRLAATIRFARATYNGNLRNQADRADAFHEARAEGVTVFDALRAQILLKVADDNAALVTAWLRSIEFGDFHDNYEAYVISQHQLASGKVEESLERLLLLRAHILERPDEVQSVTHVLPKVDEAIARAYSRDNDRDDTLERVGPVDGLKSLIRSESFP